MSFRLEEDVLDEVCAMFSDYSFLKKPIPITNPTLHQKH